MHVVCTSSPHLILFMGNSLHNYLPYSVLDVDWNVRGSSELLDLDCLSLLGKPLSTMSPHLILVYDATAFMCESINVYDESLQCIYRHARLRPVSECPRSFSLVYLLSTVTRLRTQALLFFFCIFLLSFFVPPICLSY